MELPEPPWFQDAIADLARDLPVQRDMMHILDAPLYRTENSDHASRLRMVRITTGVCKTAEQCFVTWKDRFMNAVMTHQGDVLWWHNRPEIQGVAEVAKPATWRMHASFAVGGEF